jgi:UPF0271 protein
MKIDLNCDVGETFFDRLVGKDAQLMPLISSCNIACGFHGGDPKTIENTLLLAAKYQVKVGAHPSFPDLENFGRTYMRLSSEELKACLRYQITALRGMADLQGVRLVHVKPHGALYNAAAVDFDLAVQIAEVIQEFDLLYVGMAQSEMEKAAQHVQLPFVREAFADRSYTSHGTLLPRDQPNAVLTDFSLVVEQSLNIVKKGRVISSNNEEIPIVADTLCVHGDTKNALELLMALRAAFENHGIRVKAFQND